MIVEDSDVYVDGGADFAGIYFGREADTTGVGNFSGADTGVIVTSDNQAGLFIGRDGRANGVLTVSDDATVALTGDGNFILVGRDSGSTTPSPAALAMLVSGLFGIRLVRRRR